jgi:hypothetical protein
MARLWRKNLEPDFVVDTGIPDGHDVRQNFDLAFWAGRLKELLKAIHLTIGLRNWGCSQ